MARRQIGSSSGEGQVPPQIRLPGVDGRENMWLQNDQRKDDEEWAQEAMMHMNLAGDMSPTK
jgi:hypothetical protein